MLAEGAQICDASLLAQLDPCRRPLEQLVRDRLETLLDRLGESPVEGLHGLVMREVERGLLALVLDRCRGHRGKAALLLGLHRNTLRQKLAELELEDSAPRRGRPRARKRHAKTAAPR